MGRNRRPPVGQHKHCEKCFTTYCRQPIEVSVSCMIINCRLFCGASFHMCKEDEHRLLCPNEQVPCLNSHYGCPFTMSRYRLAKHLEVCPASVVSCSLEWNRWPVGEIDAEFCKNVISDPSSREPLDLSLALRDQKLLFSSIKMKTLFPELLEVIEDAKLTSDEVLEEAAGGAAQTEGEYDPALLAQQTGDLQSEKELTQEEREALAKSRHLDSIDSYKNWESMFNKDLRACEQAVTNKREDSKCGDRKGKTEENHCQKDCEKDSTPPAPADVPKTTGLAPWQDGVLERLKKEVSIGEYNMYLVHHGRMLIQFGQLPACTPREKDFVYGNLEPIEVKTVRTFNVPTSYKAKRHMTKDRETVKRVTRETDTSDLGVDLDEIPKWDEIQATLLCSLERELRGHAICETTLTDGLFVNMGTQTYDFKTAPFKEDSTLADVIADQPLGFHVQVQTESVTRRHNKASSAFTFHCSHSFRRDEFASHFRNVHTDLQAGLNGWFEQRCPLAYLGCTYIQKRFQPWGQRASFVYNQDLSAFTLRPEVPPVLFEGVKRAVPDRKRARNFDSLSRLPFEILQHIAGFLDSFTLCQLSQVSQLMRDVCATLLWERGMVSLKWEKKSYSHGGSCWKSRKKVWQFSSVFSTVDRWGFDDVPSMAAHLRICPFYEREEKNGRMPLLGLCANDGDEEQQSLVSMFVKQK